MKKENNDIRKIDEKEEEKVSGGWFREPPHVEPAMQAKYIGLGISYKHHIFKRDEYFYKGKPISKQEARDICLSNGNEKVIKRIEENHKNDW